MQTVNQPTYLPTNKLTAATVTSFLVAFLGLIIRNYWPDWYDPDLWYAATPIIAALVGYFVKDAPNTSDLSSDEYHEGF